MPAVKTPWIGHMGEVPMHIDYYQGSMVEKVEKIAEKYPDYIAYDFLGKGTTYKEFVEQIHACARSFKAIGIAEGESITICMPNVPQTLIAFYAANLIGAMSNMVHPLSSANEIEFYLRDAKSSVCLTMDFNYEKLETVRNTYPLKHLLITGVGDALTAVKKAGYKITEGRKIKKIPEEAPIFRWPNFIKAGERYKGDYIVKRVGADPAVTLYSGGTTGKTKGILLSNLNFNALSAQIVATNPMFKPGDKMLAVMPMFHGFGLGVSIHSMLANGGRCLLIPRFNAESYAELLKKLKPNFIAGVPTLFEGLLRIKTLDGVDLSCLKGVFSGGDTLPIELKKRFDDFLEKHGASIQIREGYGTTECVTASCLTPVTEAREGSIGIPFPDTYYKIVAVGTENELPYGEEGEICLSGPTVMLEYVNHPEETANTLRRHADGLTWVHTGDLGYMDADGFVYFRQRIKRMIVTSGYNVYPGQIENILDKHEYVHLSCVIGVPDPYKMQKVKAFVVLMPGVQPNEKTKAELMEYCRSNIIRYAVPYDIEFRDSLPKTLVGKVAYRVLEEEEKQKRTEKASEQK